MRKQIYLASQEIHKESSKKKVMDNNQTSNKLKMITIGNQLEEPTKYRNSYLI